MRPIITIPSYNRPDAKIFNKLDSIKLQKFVFVRKEQYQDYEYLQDKGFNIVVLPTTIEELGKTRRYIVYWCNKHRYDWAFMFDDDISKVEVLGERDDGTWNSQRIIDGSKTPPRFENKALRLWYKLAKQYNLSSSSPNHRAYDRFNHGPIIRVNKSAIIQCFLLKTKDIISVGNFKDTRLYGAEDYEIQYRLMSKGYKTGKIGLVEFDAPAIGNISDGTEDAFVKKYERFVSCFKEKVCDDPELIGVKTTKTGVPSIQFKWKNWGGYDIKLEVDNYV